MAGGVIVSLRPDIAAAADAAMTAESHRPDQTSWYFDCAILPAGYRVTIGNAGGFRFTFPPVAGAVPDADELCDAYLDACIFDIRRRRDVRI